MMDLLALFYLDLLSMSSIAQSVKRLNYGSQGSISNKGGDFSLRRRAQSAVDSTSYPPGTRDFLREQSDRMCRNHLPHLGVEG
jgi:hypothetical protein